MAKCRQYSCLRARTGLEQDIRALLRGIDCIVREHRQTLDNLTATQQRCNELLEENRALKAQLKQGMQ